MQIKSVLTLYCAPKVLFLTSVVILLVSRGPELSFIWRGGFTGLEGSVGCQILGGGGSSPPCILILWGGGGG